MRNYPMKNTKHHPVKIYDEVEEGDTNNTNNHSLPDHPSLESFQHSLPLPSSSTSTTTCCNNKGASCSSFNICSSRKSAISCLGAGLIIIISALVLLLKGETSPSLFSRDSTTIEFAPLPPQSEPLTRIAFGSCINQNFPQPFWDTLASIRPNITILGGDNVYANCDSIQSCPVTMATAYEKQMSNPSFMGAMEVLPIIATLDNHDYGLGNADRNNPYKDIAKQYFMDFFQVPETDERRTRDGVYTSYMYGDVKKGTGLQIILLDVRHACSEMSGSRDGNENGIDINTDTETMLGDVQWEWLHEQFSVPADVRLVVSSIQLIATGHPFFCWNNISTKELERFYKFLSDSSYSGTTIILSGDRHVGGIYRHNLTDTDEVSPPSPSPSSPVNGISSSLYEITASSFTHTVPLPPDAPDDFCWNPGGTTSEECDDPDPERLYPYVRVNHFASLNFDWARRVVIAGLVRTDATLKSHAHHYNLPDSGETLQSVEIGF